MDRIEVFPDQPTLDVVKPTFDERKRMRKTWLYELIFPYVYEDKGKRFRIVIPVGFRHDGASVPRLVYTLSGLTPDGPIRAAALVHDFLYRYDGRLPDGSILIELSPDQWVPYQLEFSRKQADQLFLRLMKLSGIRWSQRWVAYLAVRIGGPRWISYE